MQLCQELLNYTTRITIQENLPSTTSLLRP